MSMTVATLARQLGESGLSVSVHGDGSREVSRAATLDRAGPGDLSFAVGGKYKAKLSESQAAAVIVPEALVAFCQTAAIVSDNPYLAYARSVRLLYPAPPVVPGVHPAAFVDETATVAQSASIGPRAVIGAGAVIAENCIIGAGCVIGDNARIGRGSRLYANVTVYHDCVMGAQCQIQSGAVIGSDGFGYANNLGAWEHIPQVGRVVMGDRVHVGASTTIDRGAINDTLLADGVTVDNLVQIGHNVELGENTIVVACAGIAGSARIGPNCAIGGGARIQGHIEIAAGTQVFANSFVNHSIHQPTTLSSAIPAMDVSDWNKNAARVRGLDKLARRLGALEKRVKEILER